MYIFPGDIAIAIASYSIIKLNSHVFLKVAKVGNIGHVAINS